MSGVGKSQTRFKFHGVQVDDRQNSQSRQQNVLR